MDSPFAFVGSSSLHENFIGRSEIINSIKDKIKNGCEMMSLVGLPRMGKTSLIRHLFLDDYMPEWWFSNYKIIPIYSDIGKHPTANNLWGAIALNMSFALTKKDIILKNINSVKLDEIKDDLKRIISLPNAADRHSSLEACLIAIKETFNIKFTFIFDELDYLWKYEYTQDQFNQLRSMSVYGHVITCSRRKPSHIEKMAFKSNYFNNKTYKNLWVTPFSPEEVEEYWRHFKQFFSELNDTAYSEYKLLAERYTGNHPHMMNIMNNEALESGNLIEWAQTINTKQKNEAERKLRFSLKDAFKKQMEYVKEQELKDSSIRLVLEGAKLPSEEEIDDLLDYGFIRKVPSEVKRDIFGYDMGPTTEDGKCRFICMSAFFTHLMKEEYEPEISGIQLLRTTEKKLQRFVKELLKKQYGPDCLESEADESSYNYKEKWEEYFEPKDDEWNVEELTSDEFELHKKEIENWRKELRSWKSRREARYNRVTNGCKPLSERQLIDTLSSFDIGSFIYVFFNKKKPWNNDASEYAKKWKSHLQKWGLWRNAELHFYVEEKTIEFVQKAEASCRLICSDIDNWINLHQDYSSN